MVVFFSMMIGIMGLISIPTSVQAVAQAQSAGFKVFGIINRVPEIDSANPGNAAEFHLNFCLRYFTDGIKVERLTGKIEFRNIDFHYPTRPTVPILRNFSLIINPGQRVAIVGYDSFCNCSVILKILQPFWIRQIYFGSFSTTILRYGRRRCHN